MLRVNKRNGLFQWVCAAILLACVSSHANADVQLPHGEYFLEVDDMSVKVLGGHVTASRTWYKGKWYFNRAWSPLQFTYDTLSGDVKTIDRNEDIFERDATNPNLYRFDVSATIERTADGWRWSDRKRNWIDYDNEGRVVAYGDRNNVKVSVQYTDGKRSAVLDHFDNVVLTYEYDTDSGLLRFVRSPTRVVEYRYTGSDLTEVVDVLGHSWFYSYESGQLKTHTDAEGRVTTLAYDATGRLVTETGSDNLSMQYRYDYDKTKREYYVKVTELDGRVIERWYDRDGVQTRYDRYSNTNESVQFDGNHRIVTNERGLETRYERDVWDNVTKTIYPDGATETTEYDYRFDLPKQKTDALGSVTAYQYDGNGNLLQMQEAMGTAVERATKYTYGGYGRLTSQKQVGSDPTRDAVTEFGYDDKGNLVQVTDPEGHVSKYTHDEMGNVLKRTDALGHDWVSTYNAAGWIETRRDPELNVQRYEYDKVGNRAKAIDARGNESTMVFDVRNRLIEITDYEGHATTLAYDTSGRLVGLTGPLGSRSTLVYDADGRLVAQTDPAGNTTTQHYDDQGGIDKTVAYAGLVTQTQYPTYLQTYDFDSRNRRTRVIDHLGLADRRVTETTYDLAGNLIITKDPQERITRYRYDKLGRLVEVVDPLNQSTFFEYDNRDNRVSVTDPNGHTTRYKFDKNDRVVEEIRPEGQIYSYTYDAVGNQIETADPDGRRTEYTYDTADRLRQRRHYLAGVTAPERAIDFSYDADGNLLNWNDGSFDTTYTYDGNGRQLSESINYGSFVLTYQYKYDSAGHKTSFISPDGTAITYAWNSDQLQKIGIPNVGDIGFADYEWGEAKLITYPGGTKRQIELDPLQRPLSIVASDAGTNPAMDYAYVYDVVGNITEKSTQARTYRYRYDDLDRLTESVSSFETEGWSYDANGNRLSDNLNPGVWQYSDNDELIESPGTAYGYDEAGNVVQKSVGGMVSTLYAYNAENRLTQISDNSGNLIAEYVYDPFGRRIAKTTPAGTTYFLYADEGLVGEFNDVGEPVRQYGYQPDSTWGTEPVYLKQNDEYAFYQNDHLGTPQKLIKVNGMVVWSADYRAFGDAAKKIDTWSNPLRFPGQYFDEDARLNYNYFRNYDPVTGRYIESDPIGLAGGFNVYRYANTNPLSVIDPLGLSASSCGPGGIYCDDLAAVAAAQRQAAMSAARGASRIGRAASAASTEEEDQCPDDCGPFSRAEAMARAYEWAGIPIDGTGARPMPWRDLNMPKGMSRKDKAYGEFFRNYYPQNMGYIGPGRSKVTEHPFGHPDMLGPEHPDHHHCPHFHATSSDGVHIVFKYKRGS